MTNMKHTLFAGVAAVALMAGASGAFAETVEVGNIDQSATNNATVSNSGSVTAKSGSTGQTLGTGASASVSATGAVASTSFSTINGALPSVETGDVKQTVNNTGAIKNTSFGGVTVGNLDTGASASVSATGAVASLSVSSINPTSQGSVDIDHKVTQTVTNGGSVTNNGGSFGLFTAGTSINAGSLGTGSSASISASGAVASVSDSSIGGTGVVPTINTGSITQSATNNVGATVSNSGKITLTGGLGAGASASVSAMGAGAVASFSSIK
jgi:hypothetical protein